MLLTWIWASAHILSAIAWLGGAMVFAFVIGPSLELLAPGSRADFLIHVTPRLVRFFQIVAGTTVVFGVLLLYNLGGPGLLDPSTTYGLLLNVAVALAVIAFVVSEALVGPAFMRGVHLLTAMAKEGAREPPAEFPRTMGRAKIYSATVLVLLLVVSVCMTGAGFY